MLNFLLDHINTANAKQAELRLEAALARKRSEGGPDLSLIIPCTSRGEGDATALYFSVVSAMNDLQNSGLKFEIIVVVDGDHEIPDRTILLRDCGLVDSMLQTKHGSPQGARQSGALRAKGAILVFADGHCSFPSGFFQTLLSDIKETRADLLHVPFRALNLKYFHYVVDWNFLWNAEHIFEPASAEPYRVALANHGCFAARRDSFLRVGGYWQALKGWGGEETQLNLKFWLTGLSCCRYEWDRRVAETAPQVPRGRVRSAARHGGIDRRARPQDSTQLGGREARPDAFARPRRRSLRGPRGQTGKGTAGVML